MIHACIDDLGINYFDTANVYEGYDRVRDDNHVSEGKVAELICGKAFASRNRDEFVIATKVGSPLPANGGTLSLAPEHILSECAGSLDRLGIDQIDIYYAHWPDGNGVPMEDSCGAFAQLIREGKVKHWAISNHSLAQTQEVVAICDAKGWPRPVMHQPPFSLQARTRRGPAPVLREARNCSLPIQCFTRWLPLWQVFAEWICTG